MGMGSLFAADTYYYYDGTRHWALQLDKKIGEVAVNGETVLMLKNVTSTGPDNLYISNDIIFNLGDHVLDSTTASGVIATA